jgi:hypothetical protein
MQNIGPKKKRKANQTNYSYYHVSAVSYWYIYMMMTRDGDAFFGLLPRFGGRRWVEADRGDGEHLLVVEIIQVDAGGQGFLHFQPPFRHACAVASLAGGYHRRQLRL